MAAQQARWAFAGTLEAAEVPYWMVVAPGLEGAAHHFVHFLVSCAGAGRPEPRGGASFHREDGVVDEIAYSRGVRADEVIAQLDRLVADGIVERRADPDGSQWCRATPETISAHEVAYAERHPMTTEHPDPPAPQPFPDAPLARAMLAETRLFWLPDGARLSRAEVASASSRRIAAQGDRLPSLTALTHVPPLQLAALAVRFVNESDGGDLGADFEDHLDVGPWATVTVRFAGWSSVSSAEGHRPPPEKVRALQAELTQRDMTDDLGLTAAQTRPGEAAEDRDAMFARIVAAQQSAARSVGPAELTLDGSAAQGLGAQVGDCRIVWCDGPQGETISCLTHRWKKPIRLVASRDYAGILGDRPDLAEDATPG